MDIYRSVLELIGNTPMLEITSFSRPAGVRLFAKLEQFNPGFSLKDRIGRQMIKAAEQSGDLRAGGTIIEPTAGNTGIGLALVAVAADYRVIFVVPAHFSREKQQLMRALGAEVVHTPREDGMAGAIRRAEQLAAEIEGAFVPEQFRNPANPEAHYLTTGPEIYEQLQGRIDVFAAGVGTGGTFTGVARYLKEQLPSLKAVAVEPEGSVLDGGDPAPHRTEGIGVEFIPDTLDMALVDSVATISDDQAFHMVRELAAREGLLVGSSSGAAWAAVLEQAREAAEGSHIVTIFPDSSERYLSKDIYQGGG